MLIYVHTVDSTVYPPRNNLGPAGGGTHVAVRAEARDPRALKHLEDLVAAHPEIVEEIPDLLEQVEACRTAVTAVRGLPS